MIEYNGTEGKKECGVKTGNSVTIQYEWSFYALCRTIHACFIESFQMMHSDVVNISSSPELRPCVEEADLTGTQPKDYIM